jgi:hypothetical protein
MRERIRYLEPRVEGRKARRRADTPLARLMDNTPALEAAPEQPAPARTSEEPTWGAEEGAVSVGHPPGGTEAQTGSERVPWWRRMFGG